MMRYPLFEAPHPPVGGCAFGTQLNFVRTCPCQTKDKIRLLPDSYRDQKLENELCAFVKFLNQVAKFTSVPARCPEPNAGGGPECGRAAYLALDLRQESD